MSQFGIERFGLQIIDKNITETQSVCSDGMQKENDKFGICKHNSWDTEDSIIFLQFIHKEHKSSGI